MRTITLPSRFAPSRTDWKSWARASCGATLAAISTSAAKSPESLIVFSPLAAFSLSGCRQAR